MRRSVYLASLALSVWSGAAHSTEMTQSGTSPAGTPPLERPHAEKKQADKRAVKKHVSKAHPAEKDAAIKEAPLKEASLKETPLKEAAGQVAAESPAGLQARLQATASAPSPGKPLAKLLAKSSPKPLAKPAATSLPPHPEIYDDLIAKQARLHGVPEALVHRIVMRESRYHADVANRRFLGLMQITYETAHSMGYKGEPRGLLDPVTNLTYGVPYLANAYMVADANMDRAVSLYASGYYYEAKRKHKLAALRNASSEPVKPAIVTVAAQAPEPPPSNPVSALFHALAGPSEPAPEAFTASAAPAQ